MLCTSGIADDVMLSYNGPYVGATLPRQPRCNDGHALTPLLRGWVACKAARSSLGAEYAIHHCFVTIAVFKTARCGYGQERRSRRDLGGTFKSGRG